MNIAYLFHGHSRTWNHCYQSFFDNVYSVAPGDIYIHTWDRMNSKFGSYWNHNWSFLDEEKEKISAQTIDLDGIKKAYNPKHIVVETDGGLEIPFREYPQLRDSINNPSSISPAHVGVYNMFKSQYNVFKLAESLGNYDKYFSCRLDLMFLNKLNKEELEEGSLMFPPSLGERTVFDIFSFGPANIMKVKADFYHHIWDRWYSKGNLFSYGIEDAVTGYYIDNGIKMKPSALSYNIKRLF